MEKEVSTIFLASDHAGFALKEKIKDYLILKGYTIFDFGPFKFNKDDDYSDYAFNVAEKVVKSKDCLGVLICGSAAGMCIAANKVSGARAIAAYDSCISKLAREYNNANILCLSIRFISEYKNKKILDAFLKARFSNAERHKRRINKIEVYEKKHG